MSCAWHPLSHQQSGRPVLAAAITFITFLDALIRPYRLAQDSGRTLALVTFPGSIVRVAVSSSIELAFFLDRELPSTRALTNECPAVKLMIGYSLLPSCRNEQEPFSLQVFDVNLSL